MQGEAWERDEAVIAPCGSSEQWRSSDDASQVSVGMQQAAQDC